VLHLELIAAWPDRGGTSRWLAADRAGHQVLLEFDGYGHGLGAGQSFIAGVRRQVPSSPEYPWDFDEGAFLRGRGVWAKYEVLWVGPVQDASGFFGRFRRAMAEVKSRVVQRCSRIENEAVSGFVLALTTGDKRGVSRTTRKAFSDAGLSHLVAVSGFHIGLVAGAILLLLRATGTPRLWRPYVFLPMVWIYVGLCGWPGSAVRAASMASVAAVALALGRKSEGVTVLSAVGLMMVAIRPCSLGDLGVGLSFLATAGILLLHRCLSGSGVSKRRRVLCMLVGVPVVATACTAPLSWPAFGKLPMLFVATNVMATPLVTATMGLFAAWCILPPCFSQWTEAALVQVVSVFLELVDYGAWCPPLLLPLDRTITAAAGCALALGFIWGLAVKRPVWFGLAGMLTACALLRWSDHAVSLPQVVLLEDECVVFGPDRLAVFTEEPRPKGGFPLNWKTRSFIERVSNDPPDSIWWCGTQWAMSPYHIRCRTMKGGWRVFSSSP
jgi:ComEC/Rec2-related protein